MWGGMDTALTDTKCFWFYLRPTAARCTLLVPLAFFFIINSTRFPGTKAKRGQTYKWRVGG